MIPILYEAKTTNFDTLGIGVLRDTTSAEVTEERNGKYELALEYAISGEFAKELIVDRYIKVRVNDNDAYNTEVFRIYKITKTLSRIKVNAEHYSYRLAFVPVERFQTVGAAAAFSGVMNGHAVESHPMTSYTDMSDVSTTFVLEQPQSVRESLIGKNSLVSTFGGEIEWCGQEVFWLKNRGKDRGVKIQYGVNLIDVNQENNISETKTGIYPFYQKNANRNTYVIYVSGTWAVGDTIKITFGDETETTITVSSGATSLNAVTTSISSALSLGGRFSVTVTAGSGKNTLLIRENQYHYGEGRPSFNVTSSAGKIENGGNQTAPVVDFVSLPEKTMYVAQTFVDAFSFKRTLPVNFANIIDHTPTLNELRTAANHYMLDNAKEEGWGYPSVSINVDLVKIPTMVLKLCDTVTVQFVRLGITTKAQITQTVFDSLKERYKSVVVGNAKPNLNTVLKEMKN